MATSRPKSPPAPLPTNPADLYRAANRMATKALGHWRYADLSAEERAEVAHLAAGVVVRRRATYDEALGSPEQWVSGIVRLEVLNYRGTLGRPPGPVLHLDPGRELPSDTTPQDMAVSDHELLAYLLTRIPKRQARVVRLYELGSLTYREVGELEHISAPEAYRRHKDGMAALATAAEQWKDEQTERGLAVLPFTLAALFAEGRTPEPDLEDATGEPPPSGAHPVARTLAEDEADPPSAHAESRPRSWPVRLVAPFGAVVAGVLLAASMLAGHAQEDGHAQAERTPVPAASASGSAVIAGMAGPSPPPETTRAVATPAGSAAKPIGNEAELIRRARATLAALNVDGALTALAEHARRFPTGAHAAARERILGDACAALRRGGRADTRCAGRP